MDKILQAGVKARLDAVEGMLPELEQFLMDLQAGDFGIETKTNAFDLVTEGDVASQARLVEFIEVCWHHQSA